MTSSCIGSFLTGQSHQHYQSVPLGSNARSSPVARGRRDSLLVLTSSFTQFHVHGLGYHSRRMGSLGSSSIIGPWIASISSWNRAPPGLDCVVSTVIIGSHGRASDGRVLMERPSYPDGIPRPWQGVVGVCSIAGPPSSDFCSRSSVLVVVEC